MTETAPTSPATTDSSRWQELFAVILLSAVAVVTAWCGFQASKWGGEMSIQFSQASSNRVQASNADGEARDQRQLDVTVFAQWLVAYADNRTELTSYIEGAFSPPLAAAFAAWDKKTGTPFAQPEYVLEAETRADELNEKADAAYQQALVNNQRGDNYSILTVLFALVLFLTAMAQRRGSSETVTRVLLSLAVVLAVGGVLIMLTFPVDL